MGTPIMANIRDNLQRRMDALGLNAAEVARMADLNYTAIYDILKGKVKNPRIDTIEKVSAALGISPLSLLQSRSQDEARNAMMDLFLALPSEDQARLVLTARAWAESRHPSRRFPASTPDRTFSSSSVPDCSETDE